MCFVLVLQAALSLSAAHELAVVRPFASVQEVQDMSTAFQLWNTVAPCGDKAFAEFDLFLVYSRRLDENPVALRAAEKIQNSFQNKSEPWHRCFRHFYLEAANLTAQEDVYDSRGYAVRKDWVNGPNKVFRFILHSFLVKAFSSSDYEAFFFMEFDSTPVRPFWLDQFYAEVFHYPSTAIRGSRYRGDSWDNFLHAIPESLLYHINGNAIYFLKHPWLSFLAQKLQEEADSENASVAFDVRMAQLTLDAPNRSASDWENYVPPGQDPYRDDSLLVGNYANTLLNTSFTVPEFVRHGALTNVLENLDSSLVSLAVQSFHLGSNGSLLWKSLTEASHPFREVVILSEQVEALEDPPSGLVLRWQVPQQPEYMAFCELAQMVNTTYFVFTDTYHFIPGPTHVLVNGSRSVLPYIPATSPHCTHYDECMASLDQAESFYGVQLNYHHSKFETLFETSLAMEFCDSWTLAALHSGSFEACDFHGPSADDYIAWLISVDRAFQYVPKNKERVGWRPWTILASPHPPDLRNCSVYNESDSLARQQSIKECSLYIQDRDACNANPMCTFRAMFEAGKCMSTSEFQMLPAMMSSRTWTWSSTRTTSSSFTRSSTTWTASTSITSTRFTSTRSLTTSTGNWSTTRTAAQSAVPTTCEGGLPSSAGVDVSDCIGRSVGESCSVLCTGNFQGGPASFLCGEGGDFLGEISCQEITCSLDALPDGFRTDCQKVAVGGVCFVRCPEGFVGQEAMYVCLADGQLLGLLPRCAAQTCGVAPQISGADSSSCSGLLYGQFCQVSCSYGFEGQASQYRCVDGVLQGQVPNCVRKTCEIPTSLQAAEGVSSAACAGVLHGQSCISTCNEGFTGTASQLRCEDGQLEGLPPICTGLVCSLEGIVIGPGLDASACTGLRTSESCALRCRHGYTPIGDPHLTCQPDRRLSAQNSEPGTFSCVPSACGDLSKVPSFGANFIDHSCDGRVFGEVCSAFCHIGWRIEGNASVIVCDVVDNESQGFVQYFESNGSHMPVQQTAGPRCVPVECTEGLPDMKGVVHDCLGKTTGEECRVEAAPGYFAEPDSGRLTCQDNGGFQGVMPKIQALRCVDVSWQSAHVGSTCANATVAAECWAYCEQGFQGSPRRYECVTNGTENPQLQAAEDIHCQAQSARRAAAVLARPRNIAAPCDVPPELWDLRFIHSCTSAQDGDICVVHCSTGYIMVETEPLLLSCQDGQFIGGALPTCLPRACEFAFPSGVGVHHDCEGRTTGENCTARCGEEFTYTSAGPETFECTASGSFVGTSPSCDRKFCQDLQLSALYSHNCRQKRYGDTCGVTCATGFYLTSWGTQFRCTGTFEGSLPICQPDPCTDDLAVGGVFSGDCEGLLTGESCELSCNAGFAPNSTQLICGERGSLVGAYPLCKPASCSSSVASLEAPSISHNCEGVVFGRSCSVFCAPGYEMLDEVTEWRCQLNGTQLVLTGANSSSLPSCEPQRCVGLPQATSGPFTDNCSGLAFLDHCDLRCAEGYAANGTETDRAPALRYHCGSDGLAEAEGTQPRCDLVTCNASFSIPGVLNTCEEVPVNGSCYAFCALGYRLEGQAQRWKCERSETPPIHDQNDGITLRGYLPVCLLEFCSYNIPWSPRFSHNCNDVMTWKSCEVQCAAGFVGGRSSLLCQPDGALMGPLPDCQEESVTSTTVTVYTSTETATATVLFFIFANFTMAVSNVEGLLSHPLAEEGFANGIAEIFQLMPNQIEITVQEPSSSVLRISCNASSVSEWRSLLEELTVEQVDMAMNSNIQALLSNVSGVTLRILVVTVEVSDGRGEPFVWAFRAMDEEPELASASLVAALTASGAALVCGCLCCIYGYQRREVKGKPWQIARAASDSTNEGGSQSESWEWEEAEEGVTQLMPSRDFTATGLPLRERDAARLATIEEEGPTTIAVREEPTRVATYVEDEDLFLAGINLEEDEGSDPEELRFSLEDVGVSYEVSSEVSFSGSGSSQTESEEEEDCFKL
ncbi:unnamed protein product [Durusdinium trenchii]|uniref:Sushi domain-containing protein n=1 Tax=Durusdinium trenchii TaxID=1381693 RepID=A0ABP0N8S4_9DINO